MKENSRNTRRIAKNTIFLYARSLFSLFVSLYSSRLILQALGVEDYGIYNVVGGFVSMFWLVSGSLSTAVTRFLNFEMGRGNHNQLERVFSMSLNIMLILATIVLLLTESFGLWFLYNRMNLPVGREMASFWVFQFSVVTVISGFAIVPFNSAIIANERMGIYAYLGISEALLRLIIALILAFVNIRTDKLILYALFWLIATLLLQLATIIYCRKNFSECRFRPLFDKNLFKEMFGFAGWNFLGSVAGTFSGQGVNVVLNLFFGTIVNAARGLASTVNNAVSLFVNNFIIALNPQITQSYAAGDYDYLKSLVYRGTKYSYYIFLLFAIPLFLEIPFVLQVWLTEVPSHTANFIRLTLIISMVDLHGGIFNMAQRATGRIRAMQIWLSLSTLSIFPLSYFALRIGGTSEIVYCISIIVSIINVCVILSITHKTLFFKLRDTLSSTFYKMELVVILSLPLPTAFHYILSEGWVRLFVVTTSSIVCIATLVLLIGCSFSERSYILSTLRSFSSRIFNKQHEND